MNLAAEIALSVLKTRETYHRDKLIRDLKSLSEHSARIVSQLAERPSAIGSKFDLNLQVESLTACFGRWAVTYEILEEVRKGSLSDLVDMEAKLAGSAEEPE